MPDKDQPLEAAMAAATLELSYYARAVELLDRACDLEDGYGAAIDEIARLYKVEREAGKHA